DVTPTLLDFAAIVPDAELHGRSVGPRLRGRLLPIRPAVIETEVKARKHPAIRGAVVEPWKLIANYTSGTLELYHLAEDPGETKNVIDRLPETPPELRTPF